MSQWQSGAALMGGAVALASLLVLILLYLRVRRMARHRNRQDQPDELSVRGDMRNMMDQLERLAERIDQQAEWRVDELRSLLTEANSTMAQLESKIEHLQVASGIPESPVEAPSDQPRGNVPRPIDLTEERRREILRLKSQGLETIEIARRMQMNIGEVELIMNLHPTQPERT